MYGPSRGDAMGAYVCFFICKKEDVVTRPSAGNWKQKGIVFHGSDSMPVRVAQVHVGRDVDCHRFHML